MSMRVLLDDGMGDPLGLRQLYISLKFMKQRCAEE